MTGGLSRLTGTDFDLGSNDDLFWMATRHGPSPTLYFARHDQFESQMNRQVLPVSPDWLVEAMGIVELDPATVTETPNMRADGMLEVQSLINSQIGSYRRTLVVDPKYATVRQVILRDPSGRMLATSTLSNHQHYPALQVSLPHRVQVQLMPVGAEPLDLDVVISFYSLNDNQEPIHSDGQFQIPLATPWSISYRSTQANPTNCHHQRSSSLNTSKPNLQLPKRHTEAWAIFDSTRGPGQRPSGLPSPGQRPGNGKTT
jgi:hypothetical protein